MSFGKTPSAPRREMRDGRAFRASLHTDSTPLPVEPLVTRDRPPPGMATAMTDHQIGDFRLRDTALKLFLDYQTDNPEATLPCFR